MNPFVENRFINAETQQAQTWLPCKIIEISSIINITKKKGVDNELLADEEQTPFRRCVVEIDTPVGVKTIDANLWEASRIVNELVFAVDKDCAATFDLEGDYAGSVWLNLPPKRNVDASWFGAEFAVAEKPAEGAPKLQEANDLKQ